MKMRSIVPMLLCLAIGTCLNAQPLKRQIQYGFQPQPVSDSLARAQGLAQTTGLLVGMVSPGSNMDRLGVQTGDILLEINGHAVSDWNSLGQSKADLWAGDALMVTVARNGNKLNLKGTAEGRPRESSNRWKVTYDAVPFDGGHLSAIVTRPQGDGPFPAVYFIPGYTCATVDNLSPIHPYRKVIDSLAGLGYVVYRVDKPGMGDGPNPCRCQEIGFDKELEGFRAGWQHLQTYDFVDQDNIFIFGHSMGGVEAPLLAADPDIRPRGIAVYGIIYQTWYEYIIDMLRFQNPRSGADYKQLEKDMQEYLRLFYQHYVELEPIEKILKNPRWKALLERDFALTEDLDILFRRAWFWRELAAHDLASAWANTDAQVLSMYGEADFEVFNPHSMSEIARIVNAYHPGKGQYISFPGTNHSMIDVGSMDQEVALKGQPEYRDYLVNHFNWEVVTELHRWMQASLGK